ncbi:hypothetical protein KW800_01180 [Candidatus Parcubacteria bacterium]|nr:hypothetical protein [Candidatus Parcubacteria bacterium]
MKLLATLVLLLLMFIGAWLYLREGDKTTVVQTAVIGGETTETKVEVTKTDITQNGLSSLPVGFPSDIPVEVSNITESYRAAYQGKGLVQYTVSYTSEKSRESLWNSYSEFMNKSGYTIDKGSSSKSLGQIYGVKGIDSLSIIISVRGGLSLVQINLLDRQ